MKNFLALLLLMSVCLAGAITITDVPASVTPVGLGFDIDYKVKCTASIGSPCNENVEVYYVTDLKIYRTGGWELDPPETMKRGWGEANCQFGGQYNKTVCFYENITFTVSSTALNPKMKIMLHLPNNQYMESSEISVNYGTAPPPVVAPPAENNTPENNTPELNESETGEEETEQVGFFEGIWNWLMDFFGFGKGNTTE